MAYCLPVCSQSYFVAFVIDVFLQLFIILVRGVEHQNKLVEDIAIFGFWLVQNALGNAEKTKRMSAISIRPFKKKSNIFRGLNMKLEFLFVEKFEKLFQLE